MKKILLLLGILFMFSCGSLSYPPPITHILAVNSIGDTIQVPIEQIRYNINYSTGYNYYNDWRFYYGNNWYWGYQYIPKHYHYYGYPTYYNNHYIPNNLKKIRVKTHRTVRPIRTITPRRNTTVRKNTISTQRSQGRRNTIKRRNNIYK